MLSYLVVIICLTLFSSRKAGDEEEESFPKAEVSLDFLELTALSELTIPLRFYNQIN